MSRLREIGIFLICSALICVGVFRVEKKFPCLILIEHADADAEHVYFFDFHLGASSLSQAHVEAQLRAKNLIVDLCTRDALLQQLLRGATRIFQRRNHFVSNVGNRMADAPNGADAR